MCRMVIRIAKPMFYLSYHRLHCAYIYCVYIVYYSNCTYSFLFFPNPRVCTILNIPCPGTVPNKGLSVLYLSGKNTAMFSLKALENK